MKIHMPVVAVASFGLAWVLASGTTATAAQKATPCPVLPTPAPIASKGAAKVGQQIVTSDYKFTIVSYERGKRYKNDYISAKENELVVVDLLIESLAEKGVHANSLNASVRDAEGFTYSSTLGKTPYLKAESNIPSGQKRRGWVTFEVPKTAKSLVLSYDVETFGDKPIEVVLEP